MGERCKQYARVAGFVCNSHGGKAPQVIEAARRRLAFLADPAVEVIYNIMHDALTEDSVRLNAAKTLLDRIGVGPVSTLEISKLDAAEREARQAEVEAMDTKSLEEELRASELILAQFSADDVKRALKIRQGLTRHDEDDEE